MNTKNTTYKQGFFKKQRKKTPDVLTEWPSVYFLGLQLTLVITSIHKLVAPLCKCFYMSTLTLVPDNTLTHTTFLICLPQEKKTQLL